MKFTKFSKKLRINANLNEDKYVWLMDKRKKNDDKVFWKTIKAKQMKLSMTNEYQ